MPTDPDMQSQARARELVDLLDRARNLLACSGERDKATALLLASVAGLITGAVEEGRPLGLLPHRARKLAEVILREAPAELPACCWKLPDGRHTLNCPDPRDQD